MALQGSTINQGKTVSYVILIASAAALGGFLFGYDTAVINGAVSALSKAYNANSVMTGFAVSCALLGSALGAFVAGPIADRYGRLKTMLVAAVFFTLSAIGSGIAFGIGDFIFWRALGGIAVGMASVIAPAYIAEVAPAHLRGRLGSLQQLAIVVGIFAALVCDYFIALGAGGSAEGIFWFGVPAWRWMFWTEAPPAIIYGFAALVIPESPRYLAAQGRYSEATNVLRKVIGGNVEAKIEEIRQTVLQERRPKFSDLLSRRGGLLPIVWIGMGLSILQQFVGINVIFYYSSVLWQAVGFSERDSLLITVITGIVNIVTTLIAIAYVDKFGRKPLLMLGSIGMTVTLGTLAVVFANAAIDPTTGNPTLPGTAGIFALLAANLYVVFFGFSWGPIVWVLLGEIFNNKIRAAALSVAAAVQWIANFLVSTTFPPLLKYFGLGSAYGLYTIASAISIFFVAFFIRETKGKELEEM
ncbi:MULTISPECIES: sugar porter family MFS transporter [unclassified Tolypothrix]|uniref:sugar porter family MFS transporter n=1 Tax=unclassified Tolypothrix TaxID=2649714 RepID=UPI0005EAC344|nr:MULTISPECIES: sugar porter family MFS transporter [unclassified Tolypothrix]BAY90477.1 sugar transporter [Microchaete diplosiphon NIES-3275]EKF01104.1 MFS transporter, sugar porter family protein [Tolypothrix sp. PCC 7601]MBE9082206.1 sugar porter family MFS transporter [Tolypothrix sp. LEGE 11397]UYD24643.1 sugar porter family MFS transporter [Tolypothrix sp. PCC 7712]UYD33128.1 sugar porter family MFS transporter [Tolypothrix sp. PCC 7601]